MYFRVASAEIVNRAPAWRAAQRRSAAAFFSLFAVLLRGAALDRSAVDARARRRGGRERCRQPSRQPMSAGASASVRLVQGNNDSAL